MEFNIMQEDFNNIINTVQGSVSKKNTLPILTGILIKAQKSEENENIHLTATDLELGIESEIKAEIIEEGEIVLPASQLANIIRELPHGKINIKINPENFQADLKCPHSEFNIKGYNPDEYPQLPEVNNPKIFNIPASNLKKAIDEVKFATSNDETQAALTGVLVELQENYLNLIATNTYRLAYSQLQLEELKNNEDKIKIILPGKTLNELSNILSDDDNIKILISENYTSFKLGKTTVISRLIEGQFPNYNQVIPDDYNTRIIVNTRELQQATKRASLIARLDSNIISLATGENQINIKSINSESGKAHEEIDIEIEGPDQTINIDASYLLDVLKVIDTENIHIEMIGAINPLTIKKNKNQENENYTYLIMPVRSES